MEHATQFTPSSSLISTMPLGLTFDDVLLVPQYSDISSRSECIVKSRFSKNVPLNVPIVSSPMDTVTEYKLAMEMARNGGLGIIHRFMSADEQAHQVSKVKRAQAHVIGHPLIINKNITYRKLKMIIDEDWAYSSFLVTDDELDSGVQNKTILNSPTKRSYSFNEKEHKLVGILTRRDIRNFENDDETVEKYMTKRDRMIVFEIKSEAFEHMPTPMQCKQMMINARIEKLPIVSSKNIIIGMVTLKDIDRITNKPLANLDMEGKLYIGAAIGANQDYLERAKKLIDAGVDVLVVDVANGHSKVCIDAVKMLKEQFEGKDVDIVAGSIATGEGAEYLIKAGADGIRCGIGNGSICITRIVAGSGVPQFSALMDVSPICKKYNVPLISDGGNKCSGNMCKALAIGADCVMLGRLVGGCEESPSKVIYRDGKLQKVYRGMAGYGANVAKAVKMGTNEPQTQKFTPEGVEGYIPYAGPLEGVLTQFVQGIKSGMSYCGAHNIAELQQKAKFIRMTQSGFKESGVHSINKFE